MKLKKKIGLAILFLLCLILFFNTSSYAGSQSWNSIDYDVTLNSDGSMRVVETWDVYVSETNTLFKSFELKSTDNYNFKNVKVTEVKNAKEKELRQIRNYQYHVDEGCFYALETSPSTFEIAWNVGMDNTSGNKKYKMYYTVENAVKIYNDCTEFYWQFLSKDNTMTGNNLTGRVRLPASVVNSDSLRVWGHGDLNANISKDSNSQASFSLSRIRSNRMFEVRIVTDENIYYECNNKFDKPYLDSILTDEQKWANDANQERQDAKKVVEFIGKIIYILIIVNIIIIIPFILKARKYKKIGKELKEQYSYPKSDLEYFRDIPDEENSTPAKAMFLYMFSKNTSKMKNNISKIFSATILNLALKGLISFEYTEYEDVIIKRTYKEDIKLSEDEELIYGILKDAMLGESYITPLGISEYAKNDYETVYGKLNRLENIAERINKDLGNIQAERVKISNEWKNKATAYLIGCFFGFVAIFIGLITPIIGFVMLYAMCIKNSDSVSILSSKGNEEMNQWKALKKYMEDYSLLNERVVPDIVLWEKYLVYATAFGISKKVLKQLKALHPEFFQESDNFTNSNYLNALSASNFDSFDRFSGALENIYENAYTAYNIAHSNSSDGSGGGGGFSSGGGGRRRRRKLWWSLK